MKTSVLMSSVKAKQAMFGATLVLLSLAAMWWLGHQYPFQHEAKTLGESVIFVLAPIPMTELWFTLPLVGAAVGAIALMRDDNDLIWLHASAVSLAVVMVAARSGWF